MLEQMLEEYLTFKKQEEEAKAKKDEIGLKIKEELKKLPEGKYNENGYKASATKKITFKYNDEVAIKNYIKSKGLSDDYLVTEIRTSKFNDELKKEGMLFESLKPYIVKNESYNLNVSKEAK